MKSGAPPLIHYVGRSPELLAAWRHTSAIGPLVMRYLGIGKGRYPFRMHLANGARLTLRDREQVKVFWHIYVRGCYRLPARCDTILDCGANVGIFSVWAAWQRPSARIVALEPFAETFNALEAQIRDNGLEGRVECVQAGVAGSSGQRWMMESGSDSPLRKVMPADVVVAPAQAVRVRCMTLTEALETFRLPLDLLEMDIEGSEWKVLLSTPPSILSGIRHIQLEYHEVARRFGYTFEKLIAHLEKAGHRLVPRTEDAHRTGLAYLERAA